MLTHQITMRIVDVFESQLQFVYKRIMLCFYKSFKVRIYKEI